MHDKNYYRKKLIDERLSISEDIRSDLDRAIFNRIISTDEYQMAETVLIYASYNGEADTYNIMEDALHSSKHIGCPVCILKNGEPALEFYHIGTVNELVPGYKGIPEPDKNAAEKVSDNEIREALVIIPMVGYDPKGNRLGYGKGYYDRFLGSHAYGCSMGIAYAFQECDILPCDRYDIGLDMMITENKILRFNSPRRQDERFTV